MGSSPITSLEDESGKALSLKTHYDLARDSALEEADWSFALKRFIPAKDSEAPVFGPASSFTIPPDILRVVRVEYTASAFKVSRSARAAGPEQAEWVVESGKILTDRDVIYCQGIRRMEDEGSFSALFASALGARLAMLCCYAITKSNARFKEVAAIYSGLMDDARSMDGMQGRSVRIVQNNLLNARSHSAGRL